MATVRTYIAKARGQGTSQTWNAADTNMIGLLPLEDRPGVHESSHQPGNEPCEDQRPTGAWDKTVRV